MKRLKTKTAARLRFTAPTRQAEPQSFNGALFQTAQDTLRDAGHAGGFESRFQTGGRRSP
jgi:hypothetical protein